MILEPEFRSLRDGKDNMAHPIIGTGGGLIPLWITTGTVMAPQIGACPAVADFRKKGVLSDIGPFCKVERSTWWVDT
jgi:hypothetical protein